MKNKQKNNLKENNINNDYNNTPNSEYNPYVDSAQSLSLIRKNESSDLDRTKQILFELSDLMTNFSVKVLQHHEMTHQSKIFYKKIIKL